MDLIALLDQFLDTDVIPEGVIAIDCLDATSTTEVWAITLADGSRHQIVEEFPHLAELI